VRGTRSDSRPGGELTPRQRLVLQVIEESVRQRGFPPSMREIGDAAGLSSTSAVAHQVTVLEKKGVLRREAGRPRTFTLASDQAPDDHHGDGAGEQGAVPVPLVGRIAAGLPRLASQLVEDIMPLPKQLVGEGNMIMLRVVGDSMIDAAITDGDLVVVRRESDIENGDIVAAMLESETSADGEATIKTFRKRDGHVWLVPHNPLFEPILGDHAQIIGKVVAVLRRI
jgi:repressor LexA